MIRLRKLCLMLAAAMAMIPLGVQAKENDPGWSWKTETAHYDLLKQWDSWTTCTKLKDSVNSTALTTILTGDSPFEPNYTMESYKLMDEHMNTIYERHFSDLNEILYSYTRSADGRPPVMEITYSSRIASADGFEIVFPATVIPVTLSGIEIDELGDAYAVYRGVIPAGTPHYVTIPALGHFNTAFVSDVPGTFEIGLQVPEPSVGVLAGLGALLGLGRRGRRRAAVAAAVLAPMALLGAEASAKPVLYHWQTPTHGLTEKGEDVWMFHNHWRLSDDGKPASTALVRFWPLPPGTPVINHFDSPASFDSGMVMAQAKTSDSMMITLADRRTMLPTNDFSSIYSRFSFDHVENPAAGGTFHLFEEVLTGNDGFTSTLVSPVHIPMSLVSLSATGVPGEMDAIFQGMVPTGALRLMTLDPVVSDIPFLVVNDAPFLFEFGATIPEPTTFLGLGAIGLAGFVRRGRRS